MADLAQLCTRYAPWEPSPDSIPVAQYRYYDVPLVGVIRQDDRQFLFMCLDGEDDVLSMWWYVALDDDQRKTLEAAHGEEFEEALRHMEFRGWTRLAFATTNLGIVDYEDVEDTGDHNRGFRVALDALQKRLHQLSSDADRLELALG